MQCMSISAMQMWRKETSKFELPKHQQRNADMDLQKLQKGKVDKAEVNKQWLIQCKHQFQY